MGNAIKTCLQWLRSFIFIILCLPFLVAAAIGIAIGILGVMIGCIGMGLLCLAGIYKLDFKSMAAGWAQGVVDAQKKLRNGSTS